MRPLALPDTDPKNDRELGAGLRHFHVGVNGLKGREKAGMFGNERIASSREQDDATAMLYLKNIRGSHDVK